MLKIAVLDFGGQDKISLLVVRFVLVSRGGSTPGTANPFVIVPE